VNRNEVRDLLTLIEGFERRAFPPAAVDSWLLLMAGIDQGDAIRAVREHFDSPEIGNSLVQPGQIKRRANVIRETRERAERRALTGPPQGDPPNPEYLRARRALAARFGDLERPATRAPMRADTSTPVDPNSGITEVARQRGLRGGNFEWRFAVQVGERSWRVVYLCDAWPIGTAAAEPDIAES